ncbi:hypothetical protein Tco_0706464 [Tanacetum coccineum]|uniref:Uncharacterized protein n=1 Tax=Tanacetum coccineum TaxID=301880 RepID=A0ABQ4Y9L8_9ASTR
MEKSLSSGRENMYLRAENATINLAFLSFENTSSTNEVSTASGDFGVSTAGEIERSNALKQDESSSQALVAQDGLGGYDGVMILNRTSNYALCANLPLLMDHQVLLSDEENTPANDRFSKADGFHAVPPSITENFLTPRADISFVGLDEYAIRKKIIESKFNTPNLIRIGTNN